MFQHFSSLEESEKVVFPTSFISACSEESFLSVELSGTQSRWSALTFAPTTVVQSRFLIKALTWVCLILWVTSLWHMNLSQETQWHFYRLLCISWLGGIWKRVWDVRLSSVCSEVDQVCWGLVRAGVKQVRTAGCDVGIKPVCNRWKLVDLSHSDTQKDQQSVPPNGLTIWFETWQNGP